MAFAFDIPGYLQGYRFSDEQPAFYDATTKTFHDQAGYGPKAALTIDVGSPIFDTLDGHRGIKLDNTFHGFFKMPIPWQGSVIAIIRPERLVNVSMIRYPFIFGDAVAVASNGRLQIQHWSSQRRITWVTGGDQLKAEHVQNDDLMRSFGGATDQSTRKGYSTPDGSTITETTAPASTLNGNDVAIGVGLTGCRFGQLKGIVGDVSVETDLICRVYEIHFYSGNIWTDHLTEAAAVMASLRTKYGV